MCRRCTTRWAREAAAGHDEAAHPATVTRIGGLRDPDELPDR
jgi:hypothetical protein